MESVILAIHGLRNKPPKELLTSWWKESIIEGFRVIDLPVPEFEFEIAYWANYLYPHPQDPDIQDPKHPLYLDEHYQPGTCFGPREPQTIGQQLSLDIQKQLMKLAAGKCGFLNKESLTDIILHRMFVELDAYYHHSLKTAQGEEKPAKDLIRGELASLIRKHRKKNILIIAHSMGSIIAYDVLAHVVPDIPVHSLITIGSPLGFPVVIKKIKQELKIPEDGSVMLPTPPNLYRHWNNFSDLEDVTCLNYNLRNHYACNRYKVRPFDTVIYSNYEWKGKPNPHKSFGYLRAAEVTNVINSFLNIESASFWTRIKWAFKGIGNPDCS